jgi:hypothetical protein
MKKMIVVAVLLIAIFFVALNSTMLAEQAEKWVQDNPKDPNAPTVLYDAARWCDILGDNQKAMSVYMEIYQKYPEQGEICAAALYYCANIQASTTSAPKLANTYLDIIFNQYPTVEEWNIKAKQLSDQVNHGI